jgi:hypothetical protein
MKITLHLTVEEVNAIIQGLLELPAKTSMLLIQRIHDEASAQTQPKPTIINQENDGNYTTTEEII